MEATNASLSCIGLALMCNENTSFEEEQARPAGSQYLARSLLCFLGLFPRSTGFCLIAGLFYLHGCVDGGLEDLCNTLLLLGGTLEVSCAHLFGDGLALFRCYWSQALCSEEFDAGTLSAEI